MPDASRAARALRGAGSIARRRALRPRVRFVLLTPGRTGSTLLMTLLSSIPGVRCDEEALRLAKGEPTAVLRRRATRAALGGAEAWGTSVHPEHLLRLLAGDPIEWVADLHDRGYELITLVRGNPLQGALSSVVADLKGRWHFVSGGEAIDERPARVCPDPMQVLRMAIEAERSDEEVRRMAAERSHLALVYEDDLRDPARHQATADRVARFLGLPTAPVSTPLERRRVPLLEQIENLDEVRAVLDHTRFGSMLATVDS